MRKIRHITVYLDDDHHFVISTDDPEVRRNFGISLCPYCFLKNAIKHEWKSLLGRLRGERTSPFKLKACDTCEEWNRDVLAMSMS